jgi:hypothetical protein
MEHVLCSIIVHVLLDTQEVNVNSQHVMESIQQIPMCVLEREIVIYSIIVLVTLVIQEINVNSLNVLERIQLIQMYVRVVELATCLTFANVIQIFLEFNANLPNVMEKIHPTSVKFAQERDLVFPQILVHVETQQELNVN